MDADETVTTRTRWNTDYFSYVADCCDRLFEHAPLLIAIEVGHTRYEDIKDPWLLPGNVLKTSRSG
jgi:hypothetical protein